MTRHSPIRAALPVPAEAGAAAPPAATADAPLDDHARWTPDRQAAFLRELAATHCVATAARAVGMSRQSAYRLRARLHGQPFDRGWAMALGFAIDALAQAALERALNGVEVPHYHNGELVGTSRRFDERLTIALLSRAEGLGRVPDVPYHALAPLNLAEQIARVEHGPETWADECRPLGRRR